MKHASGQNSETTQPSGFFITGTDTDVGKTYAAGCIGHTLRHHGICVAPRKPIASGAVRQSDGSLLAEDARFLKHACQSKEALEVICRYTFEPPISPQRALLQAGTNVSTAMLKTGCRVNDNDFALVEGAGGFYSPLSSDGLNRDLAVALNYPVVLVVGNRLGCLNHFLLTLEAIEHSGLRVACVIVNDLTSEADAANFIDIQSHCRQQGITCLHLPYAPHQTLTLLDGLSIPKV